jgi:hypothetical protein
MNRCIASCPTHDAGEKFAVAVATQSAIPQKTLLLKVDRVAL